MLTRDDPRAGRIVDADRLASLWWISKLEIGVALSWDLNPRFRLDTGLRSGAKPELCDDAQKIAAEPDQPGCLGPEPASN